MLAITPPLPGRPDTDRWSDDLCEVRRVLNTPIQTPGLVYTDSQTVLSGA